ncbi:Uncharacterized protein APZ42_012950 [Daphnia magna]|uniref:Reverse transcriptase domain-containing protein n=1 Tax=Daphnia magna TaxID=35525 RepID=A0A162RBF4_9CRUS|nr:Uncharacterized protein APZ42_012950 [Daphnia magna]
MLTDASQDNTLAQAARVAAAAAAAIEPKAQNPRRFRFPPEQTSAEAEEVAGAEGAAEAEVNATIRGCKGAEVSKPASMFHSSLYGGSTTPMGVASRLKNFASHWTSVTDDLWVLKTVSEGLRLEFTAEPVQKFLPSEITMSEEMTAICDKQVNELLSKQAINEVMDGSDGFVCSFFCIKKKQAGKFRPIVNLKPLNRFIKYQHFKMENLDSVHFLIREGDWMVKVDLQDAYFTSWRFCVAEGLLADLKVVVELLQALGFIINQEKSIFTPSQVIEYLGLVVSSIDLSFALPTSKAEAVKKMCELALAEGTVSLRTLASIQGNFCWAIPAIPFAQSHYRSLQRFYISNAQRANSEFNTKVRLFPCAQLDLKWWIANIEKCSGKTFFPRDADIEIFSDASLSGWGAACNGVTTRGPWTLSDREKHINELELLGGLFAIQAFGANSSNVAISIFLNNPTAVSYVNKCGGTRSRALTATAKTMMDWCEMHNISLEAVHLAGELNVVANRESRAEADASDWRLSPSAFIEIRKVWDMNTDLFTAPWNAQLSKFVSWKPQPGAMAVNTFSVSWDRVKGYAFPPFSLISRPTVVSGATGTRLRYPSPNVTIGEPRNVGTRHTSPITPIRCAQAGRLKTLRSSYSQQGFSEPAIELLLEGGRANTNAAYESAWNSWCDLCVLRDKNPLSSNVNSISDYLAHLQTTCKSYSLINIHWSMLSVTLQPIDECPIGQPLLIIKLLKGCHNRNQPNPKYR